MSSAKSIYDSKLQSGASNSPIGPSRMQKSSCKIYRNIRISRSGACQAILRQADISPMDAEGSTTRKVSPVHGRQPAGLVSVRGCDLRPIIMPGRALMGHSPPSCSSNGATCYNAIGNFNEAAEKFRRAAEFSPDEPKPWLNIAVAHLDRIKTAAQSPASLDLLIALGASTNYLGWSSKEEPSSEFTAQIRQALGRFGIEDAEFTQPMRGAWPFGTRYVDRFRHRALRRRSQR